MRSTNYTYNYRASAGTGVEGETVPRWVSVDPDGTIRGLPDSIARQKFDGVNRHLDTDEGFAEFVEFIQAEAKRQAQKEIRNALGIR